MSNPTPSKNASRSFGQWSVTLIFGLLSLAFLARAAQCASKWLRHVVDGDTNFKVLTGWSLVYLLVCGGVATVAYFMPRGDDVEHGA